MKNKNLARKIVQLAKFDQDARKAYIKNPKLLTKVKKVDRSNLIKIKKIIKKFGWPSISLVGKRASHLAWLLVQHADDNLKFQKYCLELMKKAAKNNEVSKANIAFLTDRILVNKGKPQIYGTQVHIDETGKPSPKPIRNMKTLEKLRREMGLGSFRLYIKSWKRG